MVLGTISGALFALGMCMTLVFGMERFHAGNSLWRRGSAARFGYVDRMEKNGA